jgi:hypothetical protein
MWRSGGGGLQFARPSLSDGDAEMQVFHSVVWKQGRLPIHRETSAFATLAEVIAGAESRTRQIQTNFPGRELDGFDVYDAVGRLVAVQKI